MMGMVSRFTSSALSMVMSVIAMASVFSTVFAIALSEPSCSREYEVYYKNDAC